MGPTSAEIQAPDRAAVAGVQGHGAGEVELVQGHGAVEDVLQEAGPRLLTGDGLSCPRPPVSLPPLFSEEVLLGFSPGSRGAERGGEREQVRVLGLG